MIDLLKNFLNISFYQSWYYNFQYLCMTMSFYIFVKNYELKDKIIAIFVALIISFVLSANAQACTRIPLSNSTVISDKRVLSSVRIDFNFRDLDNMCLVNAYGNEFNIRIASWSNKFKLDCYYTDDPINYKQDMKFNNQIVHVDKSLCTCNPFRLIDETDTTCLGNYHNIMRTHNCATCDYMATGVNSRYRYDLCYYGFDRFKVCKVNKDAAFEVDYIIKKNYNNYTAAIDFEHQGQKSVYDDGDLVLTSLIRYDDQFEGKYIIIDSKEKEKFWIIDSEYVNALDERNIRKIGWFRKGDSAAHIDNINTQLTVKITDCEPNEMELLDDPLEVAKFIDSIPESSFAFRFVGQVRDEKGNIYKSDGKPRSEFGNYNMLSWGFMTSGDKGVIFIGLDKNERPYGTLEAQLTAPGDWFTNGGTYPGNTCGIADNDARYLNAYFSRYISELFKAKITGSNGPKVLSKMRIWCVDNIKPSCCRMMAEVGGVQATDFLVDLWPNLKEYRCIRSTTTGMYDCKRTFSEGETIKEGVVLDVFRDDSYGEINVQAAFEVKTEEIIEPEIESMKFDCKNGKCTTDIKKTKGNFVTLKFSDCANDLITNTTTANIFCHSECDQIVEMKATFQDKMIKSYIGRLNCTKSVNYKIATEDEKGINIKLPEIDFLSLLHHFMYYWYYYVIGLVVLIILIISIVLIIKCRVQKKVAGKVYSRVEELFRDKKYN
jgi:heme exporter protein D